ncbi:uncharacterized protein LOC133779988 [Humulus lupulus]|uniref:uncharacterized protein LOC133779988 n=1 Tax=Humulus lupulus TaxID=3486 RepID=UPI002B40B230|nr:uncharacterized protein LOC133779988 [Humulus lupulus]
MSWRLASEPGPSYGKNSEMFTLVVHHGGTCSNIDGDRKYEGGSVSFFDGCEYDCFGLLDMERLVKELGYQLPFDFCYVDVYVSGPYIPNEHETREAVYEDVANEDYGEDDGDDHGEDDGDDMEEPVVTQVEKLGKEYALDEEEVRQQENIITPPSQWWSTVNEVYTQVDGDISDGFEDEEYLNSLNSDDDEPIPRISRRQFVPTDEWADFKFSVGLEFASVEQLIEALKEHFISKDREFNYLFNNHTKLKAICKATGCGWSLYARVLKRDNLTFQINTLVDEHNYGIRLNSKLVDAPWLAKHFLPQFRMNPNMHYANFKELTSNSKFSHPSRHIFYAAKNKARLMLEGSVAEQYAVLHDYCKQLMKLMPGSTTIIKSNMVADRRVFKRAYICLKACKDGFKSCRPLVGLDGCFLKGYCKGILLAAVGIDAENSMFPIAYAICEKANTETWTWFLTLLKEDLSEVDHRNFTMISDRKKGLSNALSTLFEGAEIRLCVRHLHSNFKKEFPGLLLKQKLWACARASTPEEFKRKMAELKGVNEKAFDWLMKKSPSEWFKSHFKTDVKCDMLLNNLCESFNTAILDARQKPIITLLEKIRYWLMSRYYVK